MEKRKEIVAKYIIGLSDHTMDLRTQAFAYMLGATVFERHYTIDKAMDKSADHWLSADPKDMKAIIDNVDAAHIMYGSPQKQCTESELLARKFARRSVVASIDIKKGEKFSEANLTCKRPGTGLSPKYFYDIIGKVALKDIKEDQRLQAGDC